MAGRPRICGSLALALAAALGCGACLGVSGLGSAQESPGASDAGGGIGSSVDPSTSEAEGGVNEVPQGQEAPPSDPPTTSPDTTTPDAGATDVLALAPFQAEWWNANKGVGGCDDGRIFDATTGQTAVAAVKTTTEERLLFPRADHPSWTTLASAPAGGVARDFCGRFTKKLDLAAGDYKFVFKKDDGLRIYIDGTAVVDLWNADNKVEHTVPWTNATAGTKEVRIVFRDILADALLYVKLVR
jgi:hypothetical protein